MIARVTVEAIGTALLLAIVVGSGIMGAKLAAGNDAVALLANTMATGAGLFTLITMFAPISGAHFNLAVTIAAVVQRLLTIKEAVAYVVAQVAGACVGVIAAHAMFSLPLMQASGRARGTFGEFLGEVIATFGLVLTIRIMGRAPLAHVAAAVALWITAAYWFTASTSFANPAVTFARSLTDTFAGIASNNVAAFVVAQLIGMVLALLVGRFIAAPTRSAS